MSVVSPSGIITPGEMSLATSTAITLYGPSAGALLETVCKITVCTLCSSSVRARDFVTIVQGSCYDCEQL